MKGATLSDQPATTQLYLMSPEERQAQMCQEMLLICIYAKFPDLKILQLVEVF